MLDTIKDCLRDYLIELAGIAEDETDFTDEVNLFDYGFLDSLGAMETITFLEERFQVSITQEDLMLYPMNSIDEIAEVVARKLES